MKKIKGLVHIYFGEGKGKTTAALGLAMRAKGRGKRVCLIQFFKPRKFDCGEHKFLKRFCPSIKIVRFCQQHPVFLKRKKFEYERLKKTLSKNLDAVKSMLLSLKYDVVILDELLNVLDTGLIKENILVKLLKTKPRGLELVLTGRGKIQRISKYADYITEFKKIRHPFERGILARKGIEF